MMLYERNQIIGTNSYIVQESGENKKRSGRYAFAIYSVYFMQASMISLAFIFSLH